MKSSESPRIFFVWNFLEWGGGQIYLLAIMKQAKADWQIKVVLPTGSSRQIINFIEQIGVEYELIDAHLDLQPAPTLKRKLARRWRKAQTEFRTFNYLRKQSYDVLHIDTAPWQSLPLMLLLLCRSSVFVTMHNRLPVVQNWRRLSWKLKLALLTRIRRFNLFASNQDAKESLRGIVPEEFRRRVAVTYTAVDENEIAEINNLTVDRRELLQKYNLPSDKFLVFCVGQFIDRKGRWMFLQAAQKLRNEDNICLVWITNSKISDAERQQIADYAVSDRFKLFEADHFIQVRKQLLTLIKQADAFALPSFVEGLPIALLEAMALRLPSISTRINAIPEAIIDRETGLLIEPGNADELAQAILTLKHDADLRQKLAAAGSARILKMFTERVSAQTAIENYRQSLPPTR